MSLIIVVIIYLVMYFEICFFNVLRYLIIFFCILIFVVCENKRIKVWIDCSELFFDGWVNFLKILIDFKECFLCIDMIYLVIKFVG